MLTPVQMAAILNAAQPRLAEAIELMLPGCGRRLTDVTESRAEKIGLQKKTLTRRDPKCQKWVPVPMRASSARGQRWATGVARLR